MTQRIQRHPYLAIFDGADPAGSTAARTTSTTPLQALYLLNDPLVHEQAVNFASRIAASGSDDAHRLRHAYELALGRLPDPEETEAGLLFLSRARSALAKAGAPSDAVDADAWRAMARVIFRLNEFVYID
jgi:hypothetical protein